MCILIYRERGIQVCNAISLNTPGGYSTWVGLPHEEGWSTTIAFNMATTATTIAIAIAFTIAITIATAINITIATTIAVIGHHKYASGPLGTSGVLIKLKTAGRLFCTHPGGGGHPSRG